MPISTGGLQCCGSCGQAVGSNGYGAIEADDSGICPRGYDMASQRAPGCCIPWGQQPCVASSDCLGIGELCVPDVDGGGSFCAPSPDASPNDGSDVAMIVDANGS